MKTWKKVSIGIAAFLVLVAAFVALVLPGMVRDRVIRGVEEATGRKLSVGRVAINPFTWTVQVDKVRLTERGRNTTFVSFSSARISVSPATIFRGAPVVSELRLVSPYVRLERTAPNTYNFSDLLKRKETGGEKPAKTTRFSLNNIIVSNGAIDFLDEAATVEKTHTVRRLDLSIPFIGNMPYMASRYVTPQLSAVVNGAAFKTAGKLKIYPQIAEASLDISLKDLNLPFYQAYVPATLPVSVETGTLTTTLDIRYRVAGNKQPELILSGGAVLANLFLKDRTGSPIFALKRGEARIRQANVMADEFNLSSVSTDGLEVYLSRDRRGGWSHERLASGKPSTPSDKKTLLNIDKVEMRGGAFHFDDRFAGGGYKTDLRNINIDINGFSTAPGKKSGIVFSAESGRGEKLAVKGDFSLSPVSVTAAVDLSGLALDSYYPYLNTVLRKPVSGRLDLKTDLGFSRETGLKLENTGAQLSDLSASYGKKEGIRLASAAVSGGKYSSIENSLTLDNVTLSKGNVRFSRDTAGAFSYQSLLRWEKAPKQTAKTKKTGKPFRYMIRKVNADGLNITFTDAMKEDRPVFRLRGLRAGAAGFSGPDRSFPFSFSTGYGKSASLKGRGRVKVQPFLLDGDFSVKRLPLTDFEAYLPENLTVTLADGTIDTKMRLRLEKSADKLTGKFRGELGVRGFYCLDEDGNDLLKWESLQIDKISGGIGPFTLSIEDVALDNFYSRIVVGKDGTLNLQHLVAKEDEENPEQKTSEPVKAASAAVPSQNPDASGRGSIRIDSVTMQEGVLAFTDNHLKDEYSSTFYNLGGRISGLSSEENRFADVDLRGNLQNLSPLRITGRINPLRDDLFVDLKVSFNDIDMSPFTPYSGTYLGYSVNKGKLFLDLRYRIEKKKLDSTNKVFIDQFTFGHRIESDKATNLPVRLAVALLKDRKGEIHLDLPVTGRTDDPQFSVWRVVLKMLKNLLVKAATSPFTLLSSMFGGNEDFSTVTFPYGSTEIPAAEREKLLKLATALRDRPGLKTEITGYAAKELDAEGYRNELLRKKMRTEKFLELTKARKTRSGDSPDTMSIGADEYSKYLKAVYKKEKFPKPRTFIGTLKDIPDDEMKKLILAHTVVTDEVLRSLARDRASAVANFLVKEGKVESGRVFLKSGDAFKPPEKEGQPASRVEFGAAAE